MSQTFEEKLEEINDILEEQIETLGKMENPRTSQDSGGEVERLKKNMKDLVHIATGKKEAKIWNR